MSKEDKYINAMNKLLKDSMDNPSDMAELHIVLHKGLASLFMMVHDEEQEKLLKGIEPLIREYMSLIREKTNNKATVFVA